MRYSQHYPPFHVLFSDTHDAVLLCDTRNTFTALRVVAPTIRQVWDAHRPSLCLGALSSLSVIEDDGDHSTAGITQLRGPFAGGAPSWKRGFAFSCYQQRLEAEASTPVPELPQPPASLAARLK